METCSRATDGAGKSGSRRKSARRDRRDGMGIGT
jgi:hypothetical protein